MNNFFVDEISEHESKGRNFNDKSLESLLEFDKLVGCYKNGNR